jgi:DNA-binding transcriptional regulator/RsmH inhibitor MraZ
MLMGVCCLQGIRDKLKAKEKEEWKKYREELKAWKKEHRGEA